MKIPILLLYSLLFIGTATAQPFKLMTYNIRFDNPGDGVNRWDARKAHLTDLVKFYDPDILGIQEGLHHQVQYILENCPGYAVYGVGRDDGRQKGEYSALYYKTAVFEKLADSTIWLSPTPDRVSVGWDAAMERICTIVLLRRKSNGQHLWVLNTHFDHVGKQARVESAKLMMRTVAEINPDQYPIVLMGDLNVTPDEIAIQTISEYLTDAYQISEHKPYGQTGTFNGFNYQKHADRRIDYIFVPQSQVKVRRHHIIGDFNNLLFPSDHFPVMAECEIR